MYWTKILLVAHQPLCVGSYQYLPIRLWNSFYRASPVMETRVPTGKCLGELLFTQKKPDSWIWGCKCGMKVKKMVLVTQYCVNTSTKNIQTSTTRGKPFLQIQNFTRKLYSGKPRLAKPTTGLHSSFGVFNHFQSLKILSSEIYLGTRALTFPRSWSKFPCWLSM